jgi:hypothetical protein
MPERERIRSYEQLFCFACRPAAVRALPPRRPHNARPGEDPRAGPQATRVPGGAPPQPAQQNGDCWGAACRGSAVGRMLLTARDIRRVRSTGAHLKIGVQLVTQRSSRLGQPP